MRVLSVQAGMPRDLEWRGRRVRSGILKRPVPGEVQVEVQGLEGDGQADLSVHGGIDKAVYAYPTEHSLFWREAVPELELEHGAFGENLSIEGLLEEDICVGDEIEIGSARLRVTQPRVPCFKLGMRHQRPQLVKEFLASGRTGFYLSVTRPGSLAAGDEIARASRDEREFSIAAANRLAADPSAPLEELQRAADHPHLASAWRKELVRRIEAVAKPQG